MPADFFTFTNPEAKAQYHIDLGRYFFASPEDEEAQRSSYHTALQEAESLKGKVADSADLLLSALESYDAVQIQFMRHYTYLYLRHAANTSDSASAAQFSSLEAEFNTRTAFLTLELMKMDQKILEGFVRQEPSLQDYRFAIESAWRYGSHTASLEREETINALSPFVAEWQYELYRKLIQLTPFGIVKTEAGELNALRQRAALAIHPDREVREAGFKEFYAGYAANRDQYAFALIKLAKARNFLAQLHQFEDESDAVYFFSYWRKADVTALLEQIGQNTPVYKTYQRLRASAARQQLDDSIVHPWDITANWTGERLPRFTFEEASQILGEALSPLGPEYGQELARLLDPANGRLDIVPGRDRYPGGFSKGFPGVTSVFFMGGFEGYYNDLRVVMHESTHAVHRQLMNNNQVKPAYANGPHYLFESFAIFNELLLADFLYHHETDGLRKRYYLEQFFEGKGMALFFTAQDAALEQAVFDGVEQGTIVDADSLDALCSQVNTLYSIWDDSYPELKMRWMTNRLLYEDPFYEINYVYGSLLALRYYQSFERDREGFAPRYIGLMKNGFDAPPAALLDRFLDLSLNDMHLVTDAVQFLEKKVQLLEAEYSRPASA